MKKWFKFFCLGFFSHKLSKEGARRGYTNVFLGFILVLVFLWGGLVCGDMLPFGAHYNSSSDFAETAYAVFANSDTDKRVDLEINEGRLKSSRQDGKYSDGLLVNTFERDADRQNYSVNGYNIVVDLRSADTLAEVEVYCVNNSGSGQSISYEEYLSLNGPAKLNYDFKLRYTGRALELDEEIVNGYVEYLAALSDENRSKTEKLALDLTENKITKDEYNRAIYELYFVNYYPKITEYESSSNVPLLRNYYFHQYISCGVKNYLFIFDDYMSGSFETRGGLDVSFYGFYTGLENGSIVKADDTQAKANKSVDSFIKKAFMAGFPLNAYAHAMNVFTLVPFVALMLMVATLLSYSILKLRGVDSVATLGGMFKVVGSYAWFSGIVSAVLSLIIMFFVKQSMITALPPVLFFVTIAVRSVIFVITESRLYTKQLEQLESKQTEV